LKWTRTLATELRRRLKRDYASIIHDNGVWLPINHVTAAVARDLKIKRIVAPRGMLSAWSMRRGRLHKRLAWWAYQRLDLQSASLLHATSSSEAQDFRDLDLRQPIAVVPNGVEIPEMIRDAHDSKTAHRNAGVRTALFLSRIHPKKGLLDLVKVWSQLQPVGWRVVVAGPDESHHQREVESLAGRLGVRDQFDFIGPVADADKWSLYKRSDLFVLPSYSENFGLVIAEAMGAGLPVVTTHQTPWQEIEQLNAGWWIGTGAESLLPALREATSISDLQRKEMGLRGQSLITREYSWSAAAEKMRAVCLWLNGSGVQPKCLTFE
jgi:glycosyltransferase involved in cell wall biosynthesis